MCLIRLRNGTQNQHEHSCKITSANWHTKVEMYTYIHFLFHPFKPYWNAERPKKIKRNRQHRCANENLYLSAAYNTIEIADEITKREHTRGQVFWSISEFEVKKLPIMRNVSIFYSKLNVTQHIRTGKKLHFIYSNKTKQ